MSANRDTIRSASPTDPLGVQPLSRPVSCSSNQHLHYDVPHVLVGGASGRLKGERHLPFASRTVPTGNLLLSISDMFNVGPTHFGDRTGRLAGV